LRVSLEGCARICLRLRCACAHDTRAGADVFMADDVCGHSMGRVRHRDMRMCA
jgi:hypothetical protein